MVVLIVASCGNVLLLLYSMIESQLHVLLSHPHILTFISFVLISSVAYFILFSMYHNLCFHCNHILHCLPSYSSSPYPMVIPHHHVFTSSTHSCRQVLKLNFSNSPFHKIVDYNNPGGLSLVWMHYESSIHADNKTSNWKSEVPSWAWPQVLQPIWLEAQ